MSDMLGDVIDTVQTGAQFLDNMMPVSNSTPIPQRFRHG